MVYLFVMLDIKCNALFSNKIHGNEFLAINMKKHEITHNSPIYAYESITKIP